MLRKQNQWCVVVAMLVMFQSAFAQQSNTAINISSAPSWIKPQPVVFATEVPREKIKGGIYYVLFDKQVNVEASGNESTYLQYAEQIIDNNGLQEAADINIEYDPAYEKLYWHSLSIIRDGKHINKLDPGKFSLLRREQELENAMYNGRLTANIILDDVRVGDLVEYSYSVVGQNPVYAGHFYEGVYLEWSVPVARSNFILNWNKKPPLHYKSFATEQPLQITQSNAGSTYELQLTNVEPKKTNSEAPSWYNPYARYVFSDFSSWADVANWAVPLYSSVVVASPEIEQISANIKAQGGSVEHQVAMALYYVQNNIRYLGIEMGQSSHQPSLAQDTLSRRYGDCKDKAVLLITLLRELGVKAAPVLVNTEKRQEIIHFLPAIHVFDHVIVKVALNNKIYWLDPTRENQRGELDDIHQSNYGYGLVIDKASDALAAIAPERKSSSFISEYLDLSGAVDSPVTYQVISEYRGYDADYHRSNLAGGTSAEETEQYLNFYKSYYSDIETLEAMSIQDEDASGMLQTRESYKINKFWDDKEKPKYTATFYANAISTLLAKPDELVRNTPYSVRLRNVVETISIKLDGSDWDIAAENFQEKNKYFEFSFSLGFDKEQKMLKLVYSYKTLLDVVPAEDINIYLAARERALDKMEYSIYENLNPSAGWASYAYIGWLLGIAVYLLLCGFVVSNWYRDTSKFLYMDESRFYPIALVKFTVLAIVTMGLYLIYWFYRNWSYIKREAGSNISPFWRSLFSTFWIYAFYKRLAFGEEVRSHPVLPRSLWAAAGFSAIYILLQIGVSASGASVISLSLSAGLLVFFAYQIGKIPQDSAAPLRQNSRWKWRHSGLVALCLPLYLLVFAQELKLIPNSEVVARDGLLTRDVVFMHRNKLFPVSQKIIYFYSDALLNVRDSGNGFTQGTVFAYWHDEQDDLVVKSIAINAISRMEVNMETDAFANSTIEIFGDNGDEFVVYIPKQGKKSKLFIAELKSLWQEQRGELGAKKPEQGDGKATARDPM